MILQKILSQAKLQKELRVDEAGKPFLWITTLLPVHAAARNSRRSRPARPPGGPSLAGRGDYSRKLKVRDR